MVPWSATNLEKEMIMKRLVVALSLAVLSASVLAAKEDLPFDQLEIDRALPNISERSATAIVYPMNGSAPYDQLAVDRALPDLGAMHAQVAFGGNTRSDVELATEAVESPWANDYNFIAPAQ
jgi:hypothetical protein